MKLVVTDFGNTEQRAKLVARVLELAGRTDIPIGIGIKENDDPGPQADWVKGYDLAKYPGRVLKDGVQALIDTVMASPVPMTLIAIGPPPNLKAALEREPRIAGKLRLAGMYGSIHRGYDGKPKPEPEWNVRANPAAARAVLAAPWREAILTPLDTCGRVQLSGERYARVRGSSDPLLRGLVEAYGTWCRNRDWCAKDPAFVAAKSSTLFDCVAVYLAISRDLVKTETTGVRVTDEGMTIPDPAARPLVWATEWQGPRRLRGVADRPAHGPDSAPLRGGPAIGRLKQKVEPRPAPADSSQIRPPCVSTMRRARASPRPVPSTRGSSRWKSSNTRPWCA